MNEFFSSQPSSALFPDVEVALFSSAWRGQKWETRGLGFTEVRNTPWGEACEACDGGIA